MYLWIALALCKCTGPCFKAFSAALVILVESEIGHGLIRDKLIGLMNLKMVFGGNGVIRMPCAGVDINLAFGIGEIAVSIQRDDLVKMRVTIHNKARLFILDGLFVQSVSRERN